MRPVRAQRKPDEGPVFVGALIRHDAHELARLAALVPPPRMHLTRFHGVFAPHSQLRAVVTPAQRGMGAAKHPPADPAPPPPSPKQPEVPLGVWAPPVPSRLR
jgi:hypothetical protein